MWISNHTVTFTGNGYRRSLRKSNPHSFVIPKPGLSARNLLGTSSEAADSSRDNAALRNDNSLGMFKLHHYAATVLQANSSFALRGFGLFVRGSLFSGAHFAASGEFGRQLAAESSELIARS
jgi:hypothetical protein